MSDVATILRNAADLLDRDGWRRDGTGPLNSAEHAPRCAVGAIWCATSDIARPGTVIALAADAREALADELDIDQVDEWNDFGAKNRREVTAAMRRTARKITGSAS